MAICFNCYFLKVLPIPYCIRFKTLLDIDYPDSFPQKTQKCVILNQNVPIPGFMRMVLDNINGGETA